MPLKSHFFALKYTHEPHLVLNFFCFFSSHYDGMSHIFIPHVGKNVRDGTEDKLAVDDLPLCNEHQVACKYVLTHKIPHIEATKFTYDMD